MVKSVILCCPKCNNSQNFYRYGKDSDGYQKYLCRACNHQFAPDRPRAGEGQTGRPRQRSYPSCPRCGKASFIHHDYDYYTNYRCTDKHCNHSFCVVKGAAVTESSMSSLFGKTSFKRMRYPVFVIITALSMFYLGKSSFRNISLILRTAVQTVSFRLDQIVRDRMIVFRQPLIPRSDGIDVNFNAKSQNRLRRLFKLLFFLSGSRFSGSRTFHLVSILFSA